MVHGAPRNDDNARLGRPVDPVMDAALDWFFRLQAQPDLRADFEAWRNADVAHANAYAAVAAAWDLPEMDIVAADYAAAVQPVRPRWGRVLAVAATALLAIGVWQYPTLRMQWQADYHTVTGARQVVALPDGSRMTLNTASAAALDFKDGKRSVVLLRGEAFFDVVPDPSHPFTVAAAYSAVEVKGTAFSVRMDAQADTIVLDHGRVAVTRLSQPSDTVTLEPGETTTATQTALSPPVRIDPAQSLAWLDGNMVIEDQPFGRVVHELGRYYGHAIILANDELGRVRVNGTYRLDDPERVIRSLATAAGGTVTRVPGGIIVLR